VYKLVALERDGEIVPKIKLSENTGKITNPSYKKAYRFYDRSTGFALGDVVALHDETIDREQYTLIDPNEEWKTTTIENYRVEELQQPIFKDGKRIYEQLSLEERRAYCKAQVGTLYQEITRLRNPHTYYVDLSMPLLTLRKKLLREHKEKLGKKKGR